MESRAANALRRRSDGTAHPARALSDGTLRFLALAVLELDPEAQGYCVSRNRKMAFTPENSGDLNLLQDIAVASIVPWGLTIRCGR